MPDITTHENRQFTGFRLEVVNRVAVLTLDRPDLGNRIASAAIPELGGIFSEIAERDDVGALLIRAEGPTFCVGGDVKGFAATIHQSAEERHEDYLQRMDRARLQMEAFIDLPMPVVVACQGAVAGAALAWVCGADIVLASPDARFVFPHIRLALPPDGGLSWLLPRVVGVRKATELVMTAAQIDAAEACQLGLVSRLVDNAALQSEARAMAGKLGALPRRAAAATRRLLRDALVTTAHAQLSAERDAVADCAADEDFVEGVSSFLGKRQPSFPSLRTG